MDSCAAVEAALADFAPAGKQLLDERQLLRRLDSKFVVDVARVPDLVRELATAYAVLPVGSGTVATYRNLYFDTPELQCFHDHRRGRRVRSKVRVRHYPERQVSFLEVKTKRSELVTDKQRRAVAFEAETLDREWLRGHVEYADALAPNVRIDYRRVCLVGLVHEERVTIDLDLVADTRPLGDSAIVEIKRPPLASPHTPIRRALARLGARERSLSKYCAAIALTRDVRWNRLRPSLRALEALR